MQTNAFSCRGPQCGERRSGQKPYAIRLKPILIHREYTGLLPPHQTWQAFTGPLKSVPAANGTDPKKSGSKYGKAQRGVTFIPPQYTIHGDNKSPCDGKGKKGM